MDEPDKSLARPPIRPGNSADHRLEEGIDRSWNRWAACLSPVEAEGMWTSIWYQEAHDSIAWSTENPAMAHPVGFLAAWVGGWEPQASWPGVHEVIDYADAASRSTGVPSLFIRAVPDSQAPLPVTEIPLRGRLPARSKLMGDHAPLRQRHAGAKPLSMRRHGHSAVDRGRRSRRRAGRPPVDLFGRGRPGLTHLQPLRAPGPRTSARRRPCGFRYGDPFPTGAGVHRSTASELAPGPTWLSPHSPGPHRTAGPSCGRRWRPSVLLLGELDRPGSSPTAIYRSR